MLFEQTPSCSTSKNVPCDEHVGGHLRITQGAKRYKSQLGFVIQLGHFLSLYFEPFERFRRIFTFSTFVSFFFAFHQNSFTKKQNCWQSWVTNIIVIQYIAWAIKVTAAKGSFENKKQNKKKQQSIGKTRGNNPLYRCCGSRCNVNSCGYGHVSDMGNLCLSLRVSIGIPRV